MVRYEILFLVVPDITNEDIDTIQEQFKKVIQSSNGTILSAERWGKMFLAYPIRKNEYGIYFLNRFEVPHQNVSLLLESIKTLFTIKLSESVMRYMVTLLNNQQSLVYIRPDSLEEAAEKNSSFGKNNYRAEYKNHDTEIVKEQIDTMQK